MTWVAPVHYPPKKLTLPPGKLTLKAKQYCDEFIITEVTSDEGMVMEGYDAGHPIGRILIGRNLLSVGGKEIKSLQRDLPAECDTSREVVVRKGVNSMDASIAKDDLRHKDIKCRNYRILDYSKVEKK